LAASGFFPNPNQNDFDNFKYIEFDPTLIAQRDHSADEARLLKEKMQSKFDIFGWLKYLVYDNPFFNRLFPEIKQQKPGNDLYVWIAAI